MCTTNSCGCNCNGNNNSAKETASKGTYYVTTPIYYASGKPHVGHLYTTILCDALARFKRMQGYDVLFLTGTDEHGQKIETNALKAGQTEKEFVDEIVGHFNKLWDYMNISHDRFIRTTDDYHKESVQKIFKELYDKGHIYKGMYVGKYCTPCESFWLETKLKDGKCPDCEREVVDATEEAYFFKLSAFAEQIEELLTKTDFLQPASRVNEMVNSFLKNGLEDLCVSRTSIKWGIPLSFDEKHVVYVWIDALSNYISALGYKNDKYDDFAKYWPADVHAVGKEILRFHAVIWPAILMALDLPLPKKIYGHGWFNLDGKKMGKSTGNVIDPFILGERYGVDAVRYHFLREMPFNGDSNFSNEIMINRINNDLANDLGNLVSRTVAMIEKYFGGTLPTGRVSSELDTELLSMLSELPTKYENEMNQTHLSAALAEVFKVVSRANKYIDETAPWILAKDEANFDRLATVLYNLLEVIRITSTLLSPFMPNVTPKIFEQIGANATHTTWEAACTVGSLPLDVSVKKGEVLFPRIDVQKELEALEAVLAPKVEEKVEEKPSKPEGIITIAYDDFTKVDLRTAKIIGCEPVPKAKKLLKLQLDLGYETRQVVSGIAKFYSAEQLIGKKIIVVSNLAPVVLCGVESNGMILASGEEVIRVVFLDESTPLGERVR